MMSIGGATMSNRKGRCRIRGAMSNRKIDKHRRHTKEQQCYVFESCGLFMFGGGRVDRLVGGLDTGDKGAAMDEAWRCIVSCSTKTRCTHATTCGSVQRRLSSSLEIRLYVVHRCQTFSVDRCGAGGSSSPTCSSSSINSTTCRRQRANSPTKLAHRSLTRIIRSSRSDGECTRRQRNACRSGESTPASSGTVKDRASFTTRVKSIPTRSGINE